MGHTPHPAWNKKPAGAGDSGRCGVRPVGDVREQGVGNGASRWGSPGGLEHLTFREPKPSPRLLCPQRFPSQECTVPAPPLFLIPHRPQGAAGQPPTAPSPRPAPSTLPLAPSKRHTRHQMKHTPRRSLSKSPFALRITHHPPTGALTPRRPRPPHPTPPAGSAPWLSVPDAHRLSTSGVPLPRGRPSSPGARNPGWVPQIRMRPRAPPASRSSASLRAPPPEPRPPRPPPTRAETLGPAASSRQPSRRALPSALQVPGRGCPRRNRSRGGGSGRLLVPAGARPRAGAQPRWPGHPASPRGAGAPVPAHARVPARARHSAHPHGRTCRRAHTGTRAHAATRSERTAPRRPRARRTRCPEPSLPAARPPPRSRRPPPSRRGAAAAASARGCLPSGFHGDTSWL